tara:strand:- start:283 stop:384 length:102 start_codon:yes stop_codon:yes gene_type:complete
VSAKCTIGKKEDIEEHAKNWEAAAAKTVPKELE